MNTLRIEEVYQEVTNNEGAVFFVESSDNAKFHVFDKSTNELIGKAVVDNNEDLNTKVEEIITFTVD